MPNMVSVARADGEVRGVSASGAPPLNRRASHAERYGKPELADREFVPTEDEGPPPLGKSGLLDADRFEVIAFRA